MNELVPIERLPEIPDNWDYDISITEQKQRQGIITNWVDITREYLNELYTARNILSKTGWYRGGEKSPAKTWNSYCTELGLKRNSVNGWLRRYYKQLEIEAGIQEQKDIIPILKAPEGLFDIIVIDPPWKYGRKYNSESSRVASPYPEISFEELSELELPTFDNCILWLWTTHAFIWDARKLMELWNFEYKAILIWDKKKIGIGYWLRMQCEFCLLGIKGKPVWESKNIRDIIRESRREHSRKPIEFYQMIEDNFEGKFLDYFSREKFSDKWKVFGSDINKF